MMQPWERPKLQRYLCIRSHAFSSREFFALWPQLQVEVKKEEEDHAIVLPLNAVPVKAEADAVHPPAKRRRVQDQAQVQTVQCEDQQRNVQLQGRPTLRSLVHDILAILEEVRKTALRTARVLEEAQEAEENDAELLMEVAAHAHAEATAQLIEAESVWTMVIATAVQNGGHMHDLRMALGLGGLLLGTLALHYCVEIVLDEAEADLLEGTATIEEGSYLLRLFDSLRLNVSKFESSRPRTDQATLHSRQSM
ncbi:hypothetical protein BKA83DRAFT_4362201 [Pisolithus microcarpus]|nr:hypothetical protein BKA83DRAFT_4362201 [Pisolithus microcarpus]